MPVRLDDKNNVVFHALQVEYKDMASWYDTFWKSYTKGTLKKPLDEVLKVIKDIGCARLSVVDVGCGTGTFLRRLQDISSTFTENHGEDTFPKLIGVEPSKEMLQQAQKKFDKEERISVMLKESPAEHLPLGDNSANVVVSTNAFHFFRDKDQSLQEMKRVLVQDGTLIITDWCNDYWIVKLYHFIERLRWNWRFKDRYPSPLNSSKLIELVKTAGFCEVENTMYRVRVFTIFFWGIQTIKAKKR